MKTIILNNKCHLSYNKLEKYKDKLNKIKIDKDKCNLVLFPTICYLSAFKDSKINIGSQDFYSYNYGNYTGEISLENLKDLKVNYTLVGHPERFILGLDTYEQVRDKVRRSLNSNFKTILCVGHDENIKIIKKELKYYLEGLEYSSLNNLYIAYEPTSKIDGENINLNEINYVKEFIKSYILKHFDLDVPFLYGGGVTDENVSDVLECVDGVLLGKVSTDINLIDKILKCVK